MLWGPEGPPQELVLRVEGKKLELRVPKLAAPAEVALEGVPAPLTVAVDGLETSCSWAGGRTVIALGQGSRLSYQACHALLPN